ncbi:MAG: hypothetical protein ABSD38_37125 [Syntrophorhabdales bacterium]
MAAGTTVWPNDVVVDPQELSRESPHRLVCFLLSPFEPKEGFDQVHVAVRSACDRCAQYAGIEIECRRADTLYESKAVHDDIWRHIASADLLVVDVTGLNPNVMIEYGVAAAVRRPHQVILVKAEDDDSRLPFNAFAQRYLPYRRSILGDGEFIHGLHMAMVQAITPAPYQPLPLTQPPPVHFRVDLRLGDRRDLILSPGITHRRPMADGLEYGSFYVFRNSWLLLGLADYQNVRTRIRFRFLETLKDPGSAFLGVSLRNQHFLANWGLWYCCLPMGESGGQSPRTTGASITTLRSRRSQGSTIGSRPSCIWRPPSTTLGSALMYAALKAGCR